MDQIKKGYFGFSTENFETKDPVFLKSPHQQASLVISDGIGSATAIIQKDVLD